jgi:hypothetical protein
MYILCLDNESKWSITIGAGYMIQKKLTGIGVNFFES